MVRLEDEITPEERESVRNITLSNIRKKFLQVKAEYLAIVASGENAENHKKIMDSISLAYYKVKEDL